MVGGNNGLIQKMLSNKHFSAELVQPRLAWLLHSKPDYKNNVAVCLMHGFEVDGWASYESRCGISFGTTALFQACRYGELAIVDLLIAHGANVKALLPRRSVHSSWETPLEYLGIRMPCTLGYSISEWRISRPIIQRLISHGASLDNALPQAVAVDDSVFKSLSDHKLRYALPLLLDLGAHSEEALFVAMYHGDIEVLELLLDHGHSKDSNLVTPKWGQITLAEYGLIQTQFAAAGLSERLERKQSAAVEWLKTYVPKHNRRRLDISWIKSLLGRPG
jgi:hypothetical protein